MPKQSIAVLVAKPEPPEAKPADQSDSEHVGADGDDAPIIVV